MTTPAELVGAVRAAAKTYPDRKADGWYIRNNQPYCILGHALYATGVPIKELEKRNTDDVAQVVWELCPEVLRSPAVVDWLVHVQRRQDAGMAWSLAVHDADWAVTL